MLTSSLFMTIIMLLTSRRRLFRATALHVMEKPNGYDAIDHYIIYKNGAKYDETTDQTYTDINLKSGEEYVYGVVAVDKEGVISEEKQSE